MSTLVVHIPPRSRLGTAHPAQGEASLSLSANFAYVLSPDGLSVSRHGNATRDLLPRAETVIATLAEADVSWHRVRIPKAPASRMAAVLAGMLEEVLLEDTEKLHFALPPQWQPGEEVWIAVTNKAWLASALAVLDPKLRVDRVVPMVTPDSPPWGHFHELAAFAGDDAPTTTCLTWATADGVSTWPLKGGLARSLVPQPLPPNVTFTATPAAAAPAERWLGAAVQVLTPEEHLLSSVRTLWNLRQFELAPRHRGIEALLIQGKRFMGPRWRPFRMGAMGLIAAQVLGLNLWAWQQQSVVRERTAAMEKLLRETHPKVQAVRDAPAQMARETDMLRAAAGEVSEEDFETLLKTAASAWPADDPIQTLQYEAGRLTIAVPRWSQVQVDQLRSTLTPSGWLVEAQSGRVTISPGKAAPKGGRS